MNDADETLIGEGVLLDTSAATLGARAAGSLIDGVALLALYLITFWGLAALIPDSLDFAAMSALVLTHAIAVFVGIPITVEAITRGRSLGKLALGLRIVRDDGGPIAFRQALTRALVGVFELWMTVGGIALIVSAMNKRGKRVGDILAGTYALQVRASKSQHQPLWMPPTLRDWASSVDVRRLPDGLALSIRQFLTRAPALHPQSRQELGRVLANQLAAYVSPLPPAGTHPESMMTAVLVVRRDREYALAVHNTRADAEQAHNIHRLPLGVPDAP